MSLCGDSQFYLTVVGVNESSCLQLANRDGYGSTAVKMSTSCILTLGFQSLLRSDHIHVRPGGALES